MAEVRPDSGQGIPFVEGTPLAGRRRYRYDVREFKVPDDGFHQCTGQVVAVLQSTYNVEKQAWYVTVLVRQDEIVPGLSPGEEVWAE